MKEETRKNCWSTRYNNDFVGSSTRLLEKDAILRLFNDKEVLEIGAGRGRQYLKVKDRIKEYFLADICEEVLNQEVFADTNKIKLESFEDRLGREFDVIHCWFLFHHVFLEESLAFSSLCRLT